MGSARIKGTALSFRIDGTDHWADATSVVMLEDGAETTWSICGSPMNKPGRWFFDIEAIQSTDEDSFWTFLWEHRGESVPFAYAPHGNELPSASRPHFTGVLTVPPPPSIGGAAGIKAEQVFTVRIPIAQGPYRVTTT